MAPAPVVLVLGAGKNIGGAIAKRFASAGYSVALVSRSGPSPPALNSNGHLELRADLASTSDILSVFAAVKEQFKTVPRIVIHNAGNVTPSPDPDNFFTLPVESFDGDFKVGVSGAYVAAGEAVKGWIAEGIHDGRFIYTGNQLNRQVLNIPAMMSLGVAKSASYYWISLADMLYKSKGWRFFYSDQRKPDGTPAGFTPSAEGHAELYIELADGKQDVPSYVSFVEGQGYVEFDDQEIRKKMTEQKNPMYIV